MCAHLNRLPSRRSTRDSAVQYDGRGPVGLKGRGTDDADSAAEPPWSEETAGRVSSWGSRRSSCLPTASRSKANLSRRQNIIEQPVTKGRRSVRASRPAPMRTDQGTPVETTPGRLLVIRRPKKLPYYRPRSVGMCCAYKGGNKSRKSEQIIRPQTILPRTGVVRRRRLKRGRGHRGPWVAQDGSGSMCLSSFRCTFATEFKCFTAEGFRGD